MVSRESRKKASDGFEGAITGFGLSDVIQMNVQNQFSGCISVECEQSRGLIFFRDGAIIHAELGDKVGEDAFCDMLEWPTGRFSLQPNVATTRSTIQKSSQHLLLDAHRVLDERRAGRTSRPPSPPREAPAKTGANGLIERLNRVPGVANVVVQGKDGTRAGEGSYEAEVLAGQCLYLAMVGKQLGEVFRAGEVTSATVQGSARHLLLFAAKNHYLGVLVHGENEVGAVDAEIRKILVGSR